LAQAQSHFAFDRQGVSGVRVHPFNNVYVRHARGGAREFRCELR